MPPTTRLPMLRRRRGLPMLRRRRGLLGGALAAVLVTAALTGASPATASVPSQGAMASTLLTTLNSLRTAHGLPKVVLSATMIRAAAPHSVQMSRHNALSRQFPGEPTPAQRAARAGLTGTFTGENLGVITSATRLTTWQRSVMANPAARAIVLGSAATHVGIAVLWDAVHRKFWITEDFVRAAPVSPSVQYANSVLSLLNQERAAHGRPGLRMNSALVRSAHAHNLWMARYNTMSHQLPGEAFFATRILTAGYNYLNAGENIGWNSQQTVAGVLELQKLMYNEVPPNDGHRQNILNSGFRDVGIDVYFDTHNNKIWLTQDFGSLG